MRPHQCVAIFPRILSYWGRESSAGDHPGPEQRQRSAWKYLHTTTVSPMETEMTFATTSRSASRYTQNKRDVRNLSIAGRGGEESSTREYNATDQEGNILRCRAALWRGCRGVCIGTVGRAHSFSVISLLDSIVSPSPVTAERSSEAMAANPSPVTSHTTDPALQRRWRQLRCPSESIRG